jgi:hypothetical protein
MNPQRRFANLTTAATMWLALLTGADGGVP